ncbi:DUF6973 domain-containing protein [Kitasatospora sp. NPDC004614]|uniref:DUF6973 domain-containing protein n=1 Tax=Kitasatospora sp. NPDC004614 TaxID=3364016 RepID=UPI003673E115
MSLGYARCVMVSCFSQILVWRIGTSESRNNAARHFIWMATLTYFVGATAAQRLGDAHEYGEKAKCRPGRRCDTDIDQYNNRKARIFVSSSWNRSQMTYWNNRGLLIQYLHKIGNWLYDQNHLAR